MSATDFKILVGASIDTSNLDKEVSKIQNSIDKQHAKLKAELDTTAIDNKIKEMSKGLADEFNKKYNLNVDASEVYSALKKINKEALGTADQLKNIDKAINSGSIDAKMSKISTTFKSLRDDSGQLKASYEQLLKVQQAFNNSGDDKTKLENYKALEAEMQKITNQMKVMQNSQKEFASAVSLGTGKENLQNKIASYLTKNTKLSEEFRQKLVAIQVAASKVDDVSGLKNLEKAFQSLKYQANALGQSGKGAFTQIGEDFKNFATFLGTGTVFMGVVNGVRNALDEFTEVDTILTEISKTSGKTRESLEALGSSAFNVASEYAVKATDYLNAVKEMNRAGFQGDEGNAMAQLALKTEAAGDVTIDLANDYLLATNAAYGLNGSVEELSKILDGMDYITNNNALSMQDMAEAITVVGSQASNSGVKVDELSAMIGTAVATTRKSGTEAATALKSIFVNLQNVSSSKINNTLKDAGTSMTTLKNGIEELRTPTEILKDLAEAYNSLDAKDPLRAQITTNIGGKHYSDKLEYVAQKCVTRNIFNCR